VGIDEFEAVGLPAAAWRVFEDLKSDFPKLGDQRVGRVGPAGEIGKARIVSEIVGSGPGLAPD
jgi:hypothetical protein